MHCSIRNVLLPVALTVSMAGAAWSQQGQLDSSPTLFTVLAALNAAGYDADLESPSNDPLRAQVRQAVEAKHPACLEDLKRFVADHRRRDATAELSQYISFALAVEGSPTFQFRAIANEVPPEAAAMAELAPLLVRFSREADIGELYKKAQPDFDRAITRYHQPVARAVLEINGYLRNPTAGYRGRPFQVFVDLLGAPNQIHTRSYGNEYYVVVTPSAEPQTADIRHAYLHYLLDPISVRFAEEINKKISLIDYAHGAPALDEHYKTDFLLLATECLIKAVESQLTPGAPAARQALVDQALKEGFILTPFFFEQLPAYEKQEQAMRLYFPDMMKALSLKTETQRLDKAQFTAERKVRKAKGVAAGHGRELSPAEKTLQTAEDLSDKRDLENAKAAFRKAIGETEERPLQARAYFGLARIAALQKDPELADQLFRKVLEVGPDLRVKSWAHYYLGRLAEVADEREEAVRQYQAVLSTGGSVKARAAAEKALAAATGKQEKK